MPFANFVLSTFVFFFCIPLILGVVLKVPERIYLFRRTGIYPTEKTKIQLAETISTIYFDWKYSGQSDDKLWEKACQLGMAFQNIYRQNSFEARGTTFHDAMK